MAVPAKKRSTGQKVNGILILNAIPFLIPLLGVGAAYASYRVNWVPLLKQFFLGPGSTSRILLLIFSIFNWKNLPFMWTYRVFRGLVYHGIMKWNTNKSPEFLFSNMILSSRVNMLETDYNLHKSNSTYFSDVDVSRGFLVSYILNEGMDAIAKNSETGVVKDPKTGEPAKGSLGISLGAVQTTFHREIPAGAAYEVWTRVLSWDRKWFYMVTYFVPPGLGRPSTYLDNKGTHVSTKPIDENWQKKVYATSVSRYVFKVGRLTVHPAIVLKASNILPEREGGWVIEDLVNTKPVEKPAEGSEWDWQRVEYERQQGMQFAAKFLALEGLLQTFDAGRGPAIGNFGQC